MATSVVYNGVTYSVPSFNDVGYAQGPGNLSQYLVALASATPTTGGAFTGNISFTPSTFGIVGTTTNNNAAAGNVGEYVAAAIQSTPAPSGAYTDFTSISLTPGDWDIFLTMNGVNNGVLASQYVAFVGTVAGNNSTGLNDFNAVNFDASSGITIISLTTNRYRVQPTITTTYYAKMRATYSGTPPLFVLSISARRIR